MTRREFTGREREQYDILAEMRKLMETVASLRAEQERLRSRAKWLEKSRDYWRSLSMRAGAVRRRSKSAPSIG